MAVLSIKKSKLPKSGNGLFTLEDIKKNSVISSYYGEKITINELARRVEIGKGRYAVGLNKRHVIDAMNSSCPAKYANDANGPIKKEKFKNNSKFYNFKGSIALVATKNIAAGEEIFAAYGKEYWDFYKAR